jgi:hypothetical protein
VPSQRTLGSRSGYAIAIGLAALAIVVAVVGVIRSRSADEGLELDVGVPTEASAAELEDYATDERPVYWIGPTETGRLEVTRTSRPALYVRYLPPGVALGDRSARFTTIATYPLTGAYGSIRRSARARGFMQKRLARGGLAVWRKKPGTSVYVAYPSQDYLIEVYDRSPAKARAFALKELTRVP